MPNSFGGFSVTSPLSSISHNAQHDLSSNCIRDCFGPTCQTVADCLLSKGSSTLSQLIVRIRQRCQRDINSERLRLVRSLDPLKRGRHPARLNLAKGNEEKGFIVDASIVRAALIVLLQHSLVKATPPSKSVDVDTNGEEIKYTYSFDYDRAILIQRYPRYVEYARDLHEGGAAVVEELLVKGRMGIFEVIKAGVQNLERAESSEEFDTGSQSFIQQQLSRAEKIANALKVLFEEGYLERVSPIHLEIKETELVGEGIPICNNTIVNPESIEPNGIVISFDIGLKSLIKQNRFKKIFETGSVWRVNVKMFHASVRAIYLGHLVSERYNQIQFSGAIVSAALKYAASKEFAMKHILSSEEERQQLLEEKSVFTPNDILEFLPPTVLAELSTRAGGASSNISATLSGMAQFVYPPIVEAIETEGGKFEITTRQLLSYLKDRIVHQVVKDHFGDIGARICSILEARGHLEGDAVAENAMVPAKDAREILHQLYKANYISMLYLQQSKQHNPANAMYLWCVEKKRLHSAILMDVSRALVNLRLRRQHEVEEGKDWIERAKLAGDTDEDWGMEYNKFCRGLERLDNACLQLDETLMILKEFDN